MKNSLMKSLLNASETEKRQIAQPFYVKVSDCYMKRNWEHQMNKNLLRLLFVCACLLSIQPAHAAKKSFRMKSYKSKQYTKKAPFADFGKPSRVSKLPKTKVISGHVKKTAKGYTYVNPYARSK